MELYISAATDIGIKRNVNQDNYFAEQFSFGERKVAFAILCDGMGGLQQGEVASASIVDAFAQWAQSELCDLPEDVLQDHEIRRQWTKLIAEQNEKIRLYGQQNGCVLGSTVTVILLTQSRYYILNIGDTRAYQIKESVKLLTVDHTVLGDEIKRGNISEEQAREAPMQNVLTKCVGIEDRVYGDFFFGDTETKAVYMLCSDGFRHCVTKAEMLEHLMPQGNRITQWLDSANRALIELNKQRGERDNITVVSIYVDG